jgi:drug/metabolite transporter (DMT)-like permease
MSDFFFTSQRETAMISFRPSLLCFHFPSTQVFLRQQTAKNIIHLKYCLEEMTIQVNKELESSDNPLQTIELNSTLSIQSVDFVETEENRKEINLTLSFSPVLAEEQYGHKSWISEKLDALNLFQRKTDYQLVEAQEKDIEISDEEQAVTMKSMEIVSAANIESQSSTDEKQIHEPQQKQSWRDFLLAWFCMIVAIFAGASVPPVFKYLARSGIRPCLAASWRCQCMALIIAPLALIESYSDKKYKVDWFAKKPDLPFPVIVHVLFSGLAWGGNLLMWIVGMQYTTAFIASILASSYPIMLVISLKLTGTLVSGMEMIGVGISVGGMIISCLQDVLENNHEKLVGPPIDTSHQFIGYTLCLLAASCEVAIIFNRIKTQKYVPLMQYTFATTITVATMATLTSLLLEREGLIYTPLVTDRATHVEVFCLADNCIFGWFSHKWSVMILLFGMWIVVCVAGFNYAVSAFSLFLYFPAQFIKRVFLILLADATHSSFSIFFSVLDRSSFGGDLILGWRYRAPSLSLFLDWRNGGDGGSGIDIVC